MAPLMWSASLMLLAGSAIAKTCTNFTIPVDITSRQGLFKPVAIENNLDVSSFIFNLASFFQTGQKNYTESLLQDYQTLKGRYKISAQFCHPDSGIKGSTVQLLTHGIGFDKRYWDLSYNNFNYSYVDTSIRSGYSTLAIDRLGIGNSSHGDPLNEIQSQAEVEALNAITTKLRLGQIPEIKQRFDKVIHVGHSLGSALCFWLSSLYPNNTDGLVLTGWAAGTYPQTQAVFIVGWHLHSARLNQPLRFGNSSKNNIRNSLKPYASGGALVAGVQSYLRNQGISLSTQEIWNELQTTEIGAIITGYNETVQQYNYRPGYLTHADLTGNAFVFLLQGFYDLELGIISEAEKQPMTTGELLTLASAPHSSTFKGPVLVVTGQQDQVFCGGNCYANNQDKSASSIPDEARALFPNASSFEAHIQPNTGHGLNAHYNSTAAYTLIQNRLAAHGLKA